MFKKLCSALTMIVVVACSSSAHAVLITDSTATNVAGDFVRSDDSDDFFGFVDSIGATTTIGGMSITGVNTDPAVGDYLLQSDVGNVLAAGAVLWTLDIATGGTFSGDATFAFTTDEEGTHEADDLIAYQIYDAISSTVLAEIQGFDDFNGDVARAVTTDVTGLSSVQARVVYISGFNTSNQDAEEIQISNYSLSAISVPEPGSLLLSLLGIGALGLYRRRSRRNHLTR
jgi:hypothetical protein